LSCLLVHNRIGNKIVKELFIPERTGQHRINYLGFMLLVFRNE